MDYLFVYKNGGWWLKITALDQLIDYDEKDNKRWYDAFSNLVNSKEFSQKGTEHASALAYAIGLYSGRTNKGALQATAAMKSNRFALQLDCLTKGQAIYINRNGGWHSVDKNEKDYTEFCKKKQLVFPEFKKTDMRIKQFPGGTHWYAYIGDMQLMNGDIIKWNNYEEAYEYASQFIK